jgi:hypothetical protein
MRLNRREDLYIHVCCCFRAENCSRDAFQMPFCFGASCKVQCWLKSLLIGARVKDHSCWGAKEGSACICLFCKKWLADLQVKMNKSFLLGVVSGAPSKQMCFSPFLKIGVSNRLLEFGLLLLAYIFLLSFTEQLHFYSSIFVTTVHLRNNLPIWWNYSPSQSSPYVSNQIFSLSELDAVI